MGTSPSDTALATRHQPRYRKGTSNPEDKMAAVAEMDKMLGKWQMDDDKTENFEAYAAAMGLDDATKKMIDDEKKATYEMTKEGDKYKCVTTFTKLPQEIVTFKLDEKFMEDTMGMKVE